MKFPGVYGRSLLELEKRKGQFFPLLARYIRNVTSMHEPNVTYGAQRQKKRAIDLVHNWSKLQSWELVPKIQV